MLIFILVVLNAFRFDLTSMNLNYNAYGLGLSRMTKETGGFYKVSCKSGDLEPYLKASDDGNGQQILIGANTKSRGPRWINVCTITE
jgi:hypothetical protein